MKSLIIAILLATTLLTGGKKSPDPLVEMEDTATIFLEALTEREIVKSYSTALSGLYKTTDGGTSWQKIGVQPSKISPHSIF